MTGALVYFGCGLIFFLSFKMAIYAHSRGEKDLSELKLDGCIVAIAWVFWPILFVILTLVIIGYAIRKQWGEGIEQFWQAQIADRWESRPKLFLPDNQWVKKYGDLLREYFK